MAAKGDKGEGKTGKAKGQFVQRNVYMASMNITALKTEETHWPGPMNSGQRKAAQTRH